MSLFEIIENYNPKNEQEKRDKEQMLQFIMHIPDNQCSRPRRTVHCSA